MALRSEVGDGQHLIAARRVAAVVERAAIAERGGEDDARGVEALQQHVDVLLRSAAERAGQRGGQHARLREAEGVRDLGDVETGRDDRQHAHAMRHAGHVAAVVGDRPKESGHARAVIRVTVRGAAGRLVVAVREIPSDEIVDAPVASLLDPVAPPRQRVFAVDVHIAVRVAQAHRAELRHHARLVQVVERQFVRQPVSIAGPAKRIDDRRGHLGVVEKHVQVEIAVPYVEHVVDHRHHERRAAALNVPRLGRVDVEVVQVGWIERRAGVVEAPPSLREHRVIAGGSGHQPSRIVRHVARLRQEDDLRGEHPFDAAQRLDDRRRVGVRRELQLEPIRRRGDRQRRTRTLVRTARALPLRQLLESDHAHRSVDVLLQLSERAPHAAHAVAAQQADQLRVGAKPRERLSGRELRVPQRRRQFHPHAPGNRNLRQIERKRQRTAREEHRRKSRGARTEGSHDLPLSGSVRHNVTPKLTREKGLSFQGDRTSCRLGQSTQRRGAAGGERGIRTLGTALRPYGGLANRWFKPLTHLSGECARAF